MRNQMFDLCFFCRLYLSVAAFMSERAVLEALQESCVAQSVNAIN